MYTRASIVGGILAALGLTCATANATLIQGFDSVTPLTPPSTNGTVVTSVDGNWIGALRSSPLGSTGIFQGNVAVFPQHSGTGYLGMNFNNTSGTGTISTWVMSPELLLQNGDTVSFWTRTADGSIWPDRLELRMSLAGSSTNVGATANTVGDFTTLLLSVNPNLQQGVYPEVWTEYTATISGLGAPTSGRFGFRYFVTNAGPTGANSNYIGIDTFTYTPIPEPATAALIVLGLAYAGLRRR